MESLSLKKNYRCVPSLQQFYTGGPFAVSSDGSFLACACDDKIKIVDMTNALIKSTIEGDSEGITALALSPDDERLFSASHSRQIRVWDVSSSKCLRSWKGHDGPVMGIACHASGGLLATAGADGKVLVWDVHGGYCTHYFRGHKGVVTSIIFHPDANQLLLFSGSDDATVRVWNLDTKKCMAVLEKHFSAVTALAMSEDRRALLSAGRDKVVNIWDLQDYGFKMTVPTYEVLEAVCVIHARTCWESLLDSYQQSSRKKKKSESPPIFFLTVGERGIVRIWTSEGAVCLFEQQSSDAVSSDDEDAKRGFTAAVMLPMDQGLLCVTADQQFLFYSPMQTLDEAFCLKLCKRLVGYNEEIVDMKFLGEEEQFLAVATNLEQVRVYDLESMSCSSVLKGHTNIVLSIDTCVSSSGKTLIATGSKDNSVRLWELESKRCVGIGNSHTGAVGAVAFSKKHKNFFVSGSRDNTIKVWSLDGLSEDAEHAVDLISKGVVAAHAEKKDINSLAVAPNDNLVCSGSQDRTACVWRLPDLVSVVELKGHKRGIWSVEFSPVDQCVITASGDKTIKIWSISDGSCLKTFEGHTSSVLRASFLSRGTQFVSCGADGLVKLWTVKTNECIATYDQHEDKVWALAIGKKTEMLATGGGDAVINLWYDSTATDKEEEIRKEEEGVLRGQELENAVVDGDYTKAIQVAFELRKPHKLFDLFSELCRKRHAEDQIKKALSGLGKEQLHVLFEYIREWNTKPKLCHVAQFVLFRLFNVFPPTDVLEIKGIGELLEGLIPYSQRHFSRIDRLIRSSYLLDYTLNGMSVIEPDKSIVAVEDKSIMHLDEKETQDGFAVEDKSIMLPDEKEADDGFAARNQTVEEIVSSKKRKGEAGSPKTISCKKQKSHKSKGGSEKKIKQVAYTAISLGA